jgi:Fe-Mn family superoxide dismutase
VNRSAQISTEIQDIKEVTMLRRTSTVANQEPRQNQGGVFVLPELPYPADALAPHMSAETLQYHYGRHHSAYVKKLNDLVHGTDFEGRSLEDVVMEAPQGPMFNNAAQVWNHTFFWHCLSPNGGGQPTGALAKAIDESFGSFGAFKGKFSEKATSLFGSGWEWLVKNPDGTISLESTSNAASPIRFGQQPLLTCDVWEHAYYIDYRNQRPKYIEAFWNIANWGFVAQNFSMQVITS